MKNILIDQIYFQYEPDSFVRKFFPGNKEERFRVDNSPHFKFIKLYMEIGDEIWDCYKDTDYINLMVAWDRDDKYNRWKTKKFLKTFCSIKKNGLQRPISVINGAKYKQFFKKGYEIFHGHHRASICCALGIEKISCVLNKYHKII